MAKTACEEAADAIDALPFKATDYSVALTKRLRAEGRKIVRYERLIVGLVAGVDGAWGRLFNETKRIQKARKK